MLLLLLLFSHELHFSRDLVRGHRTDPDNPGEQLPFNLVMPQR